MTIRPRAPRTRGGRMTDQPRAPRTRGGRMTIRPRSRHVPTEDT